LSEGNLAPRGRRRPGANDAIRAQAKAHPGRSPRKKDRKQGNARPGKSKGKPSKDKSWKP